MAKRWTLEEERFYRDQLRELYIAQNKTIGEIGLILGIAQSSVFRRLRRLGISAHPEQKSRYCNQRSDINIPERSEKLAEFFGIMLGDGHLSHFQVAVTLGNKERSYAKYVAKLFQTLFGVSGTIAANQRNYQTVYIGSVLLSQWLQDEGLVFNKVAAQVDVPLWILSDVRYMSGLIRGFFDTDGSVYKLKFGVQLSFTNRSLPMLRSLHAILIRLGYTVSAITKNGWVFYITRASEVKRFFEEIVPRNPKHQERFRRFCRYSTEV